MELADLANLAQPPHLRTLFADDPRRAERYVFKVADLRVDVSKQRITDDLVESLVLVEEDVDVVLDAFVGFQLLGLVLVGVLQFSGGVFGQHDLVLIRVGTELTHNTFQKRFY